MIASFVSWVFRRSSKPSRSNPAGGALGFADLFAPQKTELDADDQPVSQTRVLLDIRNRFSSVEHYDHFLFGFLTPLLLRPPAARPGVTYVVRSCGPMDKHLEAFRLPDVEVVPKQAWLDLRQGGSIDVERLLGYDKPDCYDATAFRTLRAVVLRHLDIHPALDARTVLLIDRGASPDYYQSPSAEVKTSANLRRSIPNMAALALAVEATGCPVQLLALEEATFAEQVGLFANTRCLVAQHGAALANMVWMEAGASIVEINPKTGDGDFVQCFRKLAAVCGHMYVCIPQATNHSTIEPDRLLDALRSLNGETAAKAPLQPTHVSLLAEDPNEAEWPQAARPVARLHQPGWKQRFEAKCAELAERKFDILWLGDSIVQQFENASKDEWRNYHRIWKDFYKRRNATNLGMAGDDTTHLLWRVMNGQVDGQAPKLLILMVGTNNLKLNKFGVDDTLIAIERILSELRTRLPRTRILLLSILPNGRGERVNAQLQAVNKALATRYSQSALVVFQDLTDVILIDGRIDPTDFREGMEEPGRRMLLHPTAKAQRRIAEAIEGNVAALLAPIQASK